MCAPLQEGKVIIFYSMHPDGQMDDYSLHGGCDVLDATKIQTATSVAQLSMI